MPLNADDMLLVERRLYYAQMLQERGDLVDALSLYREAISMAPDWAPSYFAMGEVLEKIGDIEAACQSFRDYLRLAPQDEMGGEVRLALLGGVQQPEKLPEPYVRALFDEYAPRFDEALVSKLDYRAPQLLHDALEKVRPAMGTKERILDLGCGTGLAGEVFRHRASWLSGLDLSGGMLNQARAKGIYDSLAEGDVEDGAVYPSGPCDLVIAADVLVYLGDLTKLFQQVKAALAPSGLFVFSVQAQKTNDQPFSLGAECRYTHHSHYIKECLEAAGFELRLLEDCVCRREAGVEVASYVCVAESRATLNNDLYLLPEVEQEEEILQ